MSGYEAKHELIQRVLKDCSLKIDVVGLSEDNRFVGMFNGQLHEFVVSPYCNQKYDWHSASGSVVNRGPIERVPEDYRFVDEVIGGQMELMI